jgi:hypothetical protein
VCIAAVQIESFIPGKDTSFESTIQTLQQKLAARGFYMQESSWLNPVEDVWSVHLRDKECPMLFSNGKGASELAARLHLDAGQHHRQSLCQQRHGGRQHHDGSTQPSLVRNPGTPHQVPDHQRRPVLARSAR